MNKLKYLCITFTLLTLSACSTMQLPESNQESTKKPTQQQTEPADEKKPQVEKPQVPEVDKVKAVSPAVVSLIAQAKQQMQSGNTNAAMSALERAIRISPRNPESYYQLGEIHYQLGDKMQARSLGQKAISLGATGDIREQSLKLIGKSAN